MIKNFTPRLYQETIFSTAALRNTLVVLPTGLGKTNIFLMLAAQRLRQYPNSKVLFIGPTRPLISQYYDVFRENFEIEEDKMAIFTGQVSPAKRAELWETSTIIFSTPQGLENDIISRRIKLDNVSLLGVDEAHRAVKEYSYVWIAKEYMKAAHYPRILALTASPGSDNEKIQEVCQNLFIEDIEVRTQDDPDVKPYVQQIDVTYVEVHLTTRLKQVRQYLDNCYQRKLTQLKGFGFLKNVKYLSKKELLGLQAHLVMEMNAGNKGFEVLKSLSLTAEAMKVSHAMELLESQGIYALQTYLNKLITESRSTRVKAVQNLVKDTDFKSASILTDRLMEDGIEHPKFNKLIQLTSNIIQNPTAKLIVFTQFRDSAKKIAAVLGAVPGITPKIFVGQQKKGTTGLSQKKQIEMLNEFRQGLFNVIIMTSVGEEGLDIPKVDTVIFFEPVPSVIRHVQRRGRTGRQEKGRVLVLVTKDTRDEAYRWSAKHKERRMYTALSKIKNNIKLNDNPQKDLSSFNESEFEIIVDYREKGSAVLRELRSDGILLRLEKLDSADYAISKRVAIEYKLVDDFVNSLIDGRLLNQIKDLKRTYERPVIIIEGIQDIYSIRNVHPNAIKGMIATIAISYGIPIIYTKTARETADMLITMAKREQGDGHKDFSMHSEKKPLTIKEQQEYIVSAFPNVGPSVAKALLKQFKTVANIVNASEQQLMQVDKVGKTIAKRIKEAAEGEYKN